MSLVENCPILSVQGWWSFDSISVSVDREWHLIVWVLQVATMFAVMKDSDHVRKPVFRKNFWECWRQKLGAKHVIKGLDGCDFTAIHNWHQKEKARKKLKSLEVTIVLYCKGQRFNTIIASINEKRIFWIGIEGDRRREMIMKILTTTHHVDMRWAVTKKKDRPRTL